MRRRWQVLPAGGVLGFQSGAFTEAVEGEEIPKELRRQVWEDLKVMEDAALIQLNKRKGKSK